MYVNFNINLTVFHRLVWQVTRIVFLGVINRTLCILCLYTVTGSSFHQHSCQNCWNQMVLGKYLKYPQHKENINNYIETGGVQSEILTTDCCSQYSIFLLSGILFHTKWNYILNTTTKSIQHIQHYSYMSKQTGIMTNTSFLWLTKMKTLLFTIVLIQCG